MRTLMGSIAMKRPIIVVAATVLCALAGCLRPPPQLRDGPFETLTVRQAQEGDHTHSRVLWGGSVVTTTPRADDTCFEIVSRPLDGTARPIQTDDTDGRFIACAPGFYDPVVYEAGREVTVAGTLGDPIEGKIGERDYRFPRVEAEQVYLWPKRDEVVYAPAYDPFWYPFWWGPPYRRRW